jgi:hypothetical protein
VVIQASRSGADCKKVGPLFCVLSLLRSTVSVVHVTCCCMTCVLSVLYSRVLYRIL